MIRLAIVSDVTLYREGIGKILSEDNKINVLGAFEKKHDLLRVLSVGNVDVVLLDMRMDNSYGVLNSIRSDYENVKIIVIAVPEKEENFLRCIESDITGYLSKESTIDELIEAVITVDKGNLYCPCGITQYILQSVKSKGDKKRNVQASYSDVLNDVTKREMQIIKLLADGMSNKQIARTLTIEISTVKNHVHNILVKLGVESRAKVACMLRGTGSVGHDRSLYLDQRVGCL